MRPYNQYCALAKALEVLGDRWTLLIVRELLIRGSCRYTDLRNGLPGIATNLLAERLRELQQAGIIVHEYAAPPIATMLFRLTDRGRELETVVHQLGLWGAPLLANAPDRDECRAHWLAIPLKLFLRDRTPTGPPVAIELRTGDEPITVETHDGAVRVRMGPAQQPGVILTGTPRQLLALLTGKTELAAACKTGLKFEGNPELLNRFQR